MWPVVKEYCDHGCLEVVLVRCMKTGRILAFCPGCGAAWLAPVDLDRGPYVIASRECPGGIAVPSRDQVAGSPWAGAVIQYVPETEFFTNIREINDDLDREHRETPRPAGSVEGLRPSLNSEILMSILPIGLMFSSFVPLWFVAQALAHVLNIPDNLPVRDQPNGLLWLILFFALMMAFAVGGVSLGFLLDALILRYALGWSWAKVRRSGLIPRIPVPSIKSRSSAVGRLIRRQRGGNPMHDPELDDLV